MKDCPSCGASVPDSAAQCPSCRHGFEEEEKEEEHDEREAGRTMLGMPAENVPDSPPDEESDDSEQGDGEEGGEREPHSTQFGMPATGGDESGESGPEIDTSASGPDESARDWSDLEAEPEEDEGGSREERSTEFGIPATGEEQSEDSGPAIDTGASGPDEDAQDWSDLNEAAADEPDEGSILSAWGVDDEEESGPPEAPPPEASSAGDSGVGGSGSEPQEDESDGRGSHETHMGMPRFDPDRLAEEKEEESEGKLGDENTAPGGPHESVEATPPDVSESEEEVSDVDAALEEELDEEEDATRQIDIDSLKEQVDNLPDEEDGAPEAPPGESTEAPAREREDTSPGSRVVRESVDTSQEDEEDEQPDPKSTFHGKAGKAMGSGFREPEQPDQSSEVVDEAGEAASVESEESEDGGPERRGTMAGMPVDDSFTPQGEQEESAEDDSGEADEEEPERSPRSTRLGQPVAAPSPDDEAPGEQEESGAEEPEPPASGGEPGGGPPDESTPPEAADSGLGLTGPGEEESSSDGGSGFSLPSPGDVDGDASSTGGLDLESDSDIPRPGEQSEEEAPSDRSSKPPETEGTDKLEEGTVPDMQGESGESEGGMGLEFEEESSPQNFFEEIEEDVASELENQDLEEVDFGEEEEELEEEFAFDEPLESEREAQEAEQPATGTPEQLQEDAAEATRQVDRPEQFADDEMELTEPDEARESGAPFDELEEPAGEPGVAPDELEEPGVPGEEPTPRAPVETGELEEPDELSSESTSAPVAAEGGEGDAAQSVIGVVAGLTLLSFLGVQTVTSDLVGHYLVISLTLGSGLGAAASLVTPFLGSSSRTKSIIYIGFGVVIAALAVSVVLLVTQQLTLGPVLALSGAILAIGAGLAPAMQ